jgi:hypothetical protein
MRLRRTLLTSLAVTAIALALGIAPAQSEPAKSDARGALGAADKALLQKEASAPAASLVTPVLNLALGTVQSNIANWVRANGGRYSFGSFVDPSTGKIVLETDAPASLVSSLLGTAKGLVDVRPTAITDSFSRKSDTSPFWGGSGISGPGGICTSGFVVKNSAGTRFLTTAGHCFAVGNNVVTENGGVSVGNVVARGPIPPFDMELIGGTSYGNRIYTGGVDSTTSAPVVAAADPVVNFTGYCHSGRTSGEACGHKVTSVTAQVCTQTGCKSPVIAYTGGQISQPGDSGSPFYIYGGSNVHIRGMVIASGGSTGYAELWSRISSHLGVSIVT